MGDDLQARNTGGLRAVHGVTAVVVGVFGVILGFWILSALAGFVWFLVKLGVIIAAVVGVLWLFVGRRR
jgi:hypothetical protein